MYQIPQTGTYRVVFEPLPGEKHGIDFSVIPSDDPAFSAGIRADEISIDFGVFARRDQIQMVPYARAEGCLDDSWPSHLAVQNKRLELRIMQVAGYKKVFETDSSMALLEAVLQKRDKNGSVRELPYSTNADAALDVATQPHFLQGDGWRGLRWIGSYSQDVGCGFDDFTYVFQGMTNGGRFFILMRSAVSNPAVARRLTQDCSTASDKTPKQTLDELFKKDMPAIFDKAMSAADPASFTPNLDQLDAVIKSLRLKH